jgi:hypothetical protein
MASNEVLKALEALRKELDKLEPAIKHVETAQQVTETVKNIPQKHIDLINEVKESDSKHKGELKELFTKELEMITVENKKITDSNVEIQKLIKTDLEIIGKLKETVSLFLDRVDKVNFPERLDKMDATISGIMAAVQSIQGRLDIVERNITDRLKDSADFQKEMKSSLQTSLDNSTKDLKFSIEQNKAFVEATAKKQQTNTYITWGLIIIGIITIILTCKNK